MRGVVVGEVCEDRFVIGKVSRLCPEAPVPILNPFSEKTNLGMAGNVLKNLQSLEPNIDVRFLTNSEKIVKTRYVDNTSGYIMLRVDDDVKVKPFEFEDFLKGISGHTTDLDFVVISDYNKGFLVEETLGDILRFCRSNGIPTFVDTKKILGSWSVRADFVKINKKEYEEQLRHCDGNPTDYCRNLIVTLGQEGSRWVNENKYVNGNRVEVMDVSGAGDTYLAAFTLKYLDSFDIEKAMLYANKAAALAVSKRGVVAVGKDELKD